MHTQRSGLSATQEEETYRNTHWIQRYLERFWDWLDHNRGGYSSSGQPAEWTPDTTSFSAGSSDMGNFFADKPLHNGLENSFSEGGSPFSAYHFPTLRDPFDPF